MSQLLPRAVGLRELKSILLGGQRTRSDLGWRQVLSQSLLFPKAEGMSEVTIHLVAVLGG